MPLALAPRHVEQVGILQSLGILQHWTGNRTVVVLRETSDSSNRAFSSISATRRLKTSSNSWTCSSVKSAARPTKRFVKPLSNSARRPREPCLTRISSSESSGASAITRTYGLAMGQRMFTQCYQNDLKEQLLPKLTQSRGGLELLQVQGPDKCLDAV